MLALNAGMRDAEIRTLQWERLDLAKAYLTVGGSKTEAGEGRTIPLNTSLVEAFVEYSKWYTKRFGTIQPNWYVFAFGKSHGSQTACRSSVGTNEGDRDKRRDRSSDVKCRNGGDSQRLRQRIHQSSPRQLIARV